MFQVVPLVSTRYSTPRRITTRKSACGTWQGTEVFIKGPSPIYHTACVTRVAYRFSITFLIRSNAQSISSRVMTSGGAIRIARSCVSLQSRPSSFSASQYGRAGLCSSMPIHRPRPRTAELDKTVDDDPRAHCFRQAVNGLYVRLGLLTMLLEKE